MTKEEKKKLCEVKTMIKEADYMDDYDVIEDIKFLVNLIESQQETIDILHDNQYEG